jgi:putative tryptophan/tyrosine transport system substrate-binding protein
LKQERTVGGRDQGAGPDPFQKAGLSGYDALFWPLWTSMNRRQIITLLGGMASTWPIAALAQQSGKLPTIGFLGAASASTWSDRLTALVERLRELGWIEGRTVAIEYRWAEGREDRFAEIAAEFVRLKVDVIVTGGNAAVRAAKQATSAIPIVFAVAGDPLGTGLVASLARPGGNTTGLSLQETDSAAKRLELLREVVPSLRRVAMLANVGNPAVVLELEEVQIAARTLGLGTTTLEIRRGEDIASAMEALKDRADALYVVGDPLVNTYWIRINTLAFGARLPMIYNNREFVEKGGLMSFGANFPDLFRRAGDFVDKILRGTKPGDLPTQQPTKFETVVNLTTAKALGLTVPPSLLATADEVIE